jgi:hypothetical protein
MLEWKTRHSDRHVATICRVAPDPQIDWLKVYFLGLLLKVLLFSLLNSKNSLSRLRRDTQERKDIAPGVRIGTDRRQSHCRSKTGVERLTCFTSRSALSFPFPPAQCHAFLSVTACLTLKSYAYEKQFKNCRHNYGRHVRHVQAW